MIAAELAFRLGADLGLSSVEDIWSELGRVSPLHAVASWSALAADVDGVVLARLDPAAAPPADPTGDLDAQGERTAMHDDVADAAIRAGAADDPATRESETAAAAEAQAELESHDHLDAGEPGEARAVAPALSFRAPRYEAPALDAYSLRLVTQRKLYDQGTQVQAAPSLAGLADGPRVSANPSDLDRLGVAAGGRVRLSSAKHTMVVTVEGDATLPQGVVTMRVGQGEPDPFLLIDAASSVTEVRLETIA
jgi:NADH-quinone oxidoreductase subunit G